MEAVCSRDTMPRTRRDLLKNGLALGAASLWPAWAAAASPRFASFPFALGVASGFPTDRSIVLWTRLAPDPLAADGLGGMPPQDVKLRWELAEDAKFGRKVRQGEVIVTAAQAHSAHVPVGSLGPARDY